MGPAELARDQNINPGGTDAVGTSIRREFAITVIVTLITGVPSLGLGLMELMFATKRGTVVVAKNPEVVVKVIIASEATTQDDSHEAKAVNDGNH